MANIYQHIKSNKRDTVFVMILFIAMVSLLGWLIGDYFYYDGLSFMGFALLISGVSGFYSYYNSDKVVLSVSNAKEVSYQEAPELHKLVENMSIASGIPKPKVYMINDPSMNAFATGRDPEHGVICFTTGIIEGLEKRELEGVVAHEMSHIGNYDTRLMSIVSVLVGSVSLLVNWFTRGSSYRIRDRRRSDSSSASGLVFILGLVFLILSPLIATLIKLFISRKREYLADSTAALITRYPKGLADALRKLGADKRVLRSASNATAHLYINDPTTGKLGGFVSNMFNTHPPIEERIRRLESM